MDYTSKVAATIVAVCLLAEIVFFIVDPSPKLALYAIIAALCLLVTLGLDRIS